MMPPSQAHDQMPIWVPEKVRDYCAHVLEGASLRNVADQRDGHASTVLRHVRAIETMRDDPLIDRALSDLQMFLTTGTEIKATMRHTNPNHNFPSDHKVTSEAKRILRRLCETDAFLILSDTMEKAVIMRGPAGAEAVKTAVLDQNIAQIFALNDWITCFRRGQISRYEITHAGKKALKRLLAAENAETDTTHAFQEQHKEWAVRRSADNATGTGRQMRYNLAESPLTALGRRKDSDGKPFLTPDLIAAGETLREDFETAQMGPRITQNWERFLTGGRGGSFSGDNNLAEGPMAARERVSKALRDLGPGLGDIALRCCCFLEGMEAAEKRMGWSARSGKIVLRIALQRLRLHYETA